jgi:hypothetical protein
VISCAKFLAFGRSEEKLDLLRGIDDCAMRLFLRPRSWFRAFYAQCMKIEGRGGGGVSECGGSGGFRRRGSGSVSGEIDWDKFRAMFYQVRKEHTPSS